MQSLVVVALVLGGASHAAAFLPPPATPCGVAKGTSSSVAGVKRICHSSSRLLAIQEDEAPVDKNQGRKGPTWMYNQEGRALAPWMIDSFDPENLKKIEEARIRRKEMDSQRKKNAVGDLADDPQQMELSGLGLRCKVVDGEVALTWKTGDESGNKGFIVQKRRGKTEEWMEVASYKDWAPLNSKGAEGGVYSFIDPSTEQGTWIYRISDVGQDGSKNDLCQALIEVQSQAEANQAKFAVAGLAVIAAAALFAGATLDPMQ